MIFMWYLKESQQHIALSLCLPQLSREYLTISMRILLCALLVRIMITASGYGVRCPCTLIQAASDTFSTKYRGQLRSLQYFRDRTLLPSLLPYPTPDLTPHFALHVPGICSAGAPQQTCSKISRWRLGCQ